MMSKLVHASCLPILGDTTELICKNRNDYGCKPEGRDDCCRTCENRRECNLACEDCWYRCPHCFAEVVK